MQIAGPSMPGAIAFVQLEQQGRRLVRSRHGNAPEPDLALGGSTAMESDHREPDTVPFRMTHTTCHQELEPGPAHGGRYARPPARALVLRGLAVATSAEE